MSAPIDSTHRILLDQVEQALMELSVMAATLSDFAGSTRAERVDVSPQRLRNYFQFQQERSDRALQDLRAVMYRQRPPDNHCRAV